MQRSVYLSFAALSLVVAGVVPAQQASAQETLKSASTRPVFASKSGVETPLKTMINPAYVAPKPAVVTPPVFYVEQEVGVDRLGNVMVRPGAVQWRNNFDDACAASARSGKPVLMFAMIGNLDQKLCETQARIARTVLFSNQQVARYISSHYEPAWKSLKSVPMISVDFGNGKVVKRTANGNIATFVCTADGTVIDVIAGMHAPDVYLKRLQSAESVISKLPGAKASRKQYLTAYHERESAHLAAATYAAVERARDVFSKGPQHRQIHKQLALKPTATPDDITDWLYKEVLKIDLNDPFLGMKPALTSSYPFKDAAN